MDVILVPGLWLDASTWAPVLPALEAAGHNPFPMTMPGVGRPGPEVVGIGMAEWVAVVVSQIDALSGPVVLVGHSGGGNVVWAAAGARPDRVHRVVFVDTIPPAAGFVISDEFERVGGVIPFPGWEAFGDDEVGDLDDATRARAAAGTKSVPSRVVTDGVDLGDARRHQVPITILSGQLDAEALRAAVAEWKPFAEELDQIEQVEVVTLGSGHWPQFSQPEQLAATLAAAIR